MEQLHQPKAGIDLEKGRRRWMIKCAVAFSSNTIERRGFHRVPHKRLRQADGEIGVIECAKLAKFTV